MKRLLLLFVVFTCTAGFAQRNAIIFEEKRVETVPATFDSILMVGSGSMTTRIFLEQVSGFLMQSFRDHKLFSSYYYLGQTPAEALAAFDTIEKRGYKAILFFSPKGETFFDVRGGVSWQTLPTRSGKYDLGFATSRLEYQQDFEFNLYKPGDSNEILWAAVVDVSGDLGKLTGARKIAAKLISCFKKNQYIH